MKQLLLAVLLGFWMGNGNADARKPGAGTVALKFPCTARAVTRIWVDDEVFWNAVSTGLMMLEPCDTLELHIVWYDSVVVEFFNEDKPDEVTLIRVKLTIDGRLVPLDIIPESRRLKV